MAQINIGSDIATVNYCLVTEKRKNSLTISHQHHMSVMICYYTIFITSGAWKKIAFHSNPTWAPLRVLSPTHSGYCKCHELSAWPPRRTVLTVDFFVSDSRNKQCLVATDHVKHLCYRWTGRRGVVQNAGQKVAGSIPIRATWVFFSPDQFHYRPHLPTLRKRLWGSRFICSTDIDTVHMSL